jgi:hypothetical protein
MFKLRTDQPLFFSTERILLGFPSNFLPLFLHFLEIDPSIGFCPLFLYG